VLNAVEHGNLEISYQVKQQAIDQSRLSQLVQERLAQAPPGPTHRYNDRGDEVTVQIPLR